MGNLRSVEKALANLRNASVDSVDAIAGLGEDELAALVRPSGTPTVKARRLRVFANLVLSHGGFDGLFGNETPVLRELLLATHGIGPETADVILLHAARFAGHRARRPRRVSAAVSPDPSARAHDAWRLAARAPPDDLDFRRRSHAAIVIHCKETPRGRATVSRAGVLRLLPSLWRQNEVCMSEETRER
jgi:endonuclease III-like uncharacterized protein